MTSKRIEELQKQTAYPNSRSVHQAILQAWNETQQKCNAELNELKKDNEILVSKLRVEREYQNELKDKLGGSKLLYKELNKTNVFISQCYNELKNRTCEGCKWYHSKIVDHPNYRECNNVDGFTYGLDVKYDFSCNKWEAK